MRVIVTAGGTREPIDDVRVIANSSTGRLGVHVAEALAAAGHDVLLLHGVAAARPTRREGIRCEAFSASADLAAALERHVPGADAVIHAAAVADYVPVRAEGKIPSDAEELVLRLRRAPKLIDRLRDLAPSALLVGFKLTSGKSEDDRLEIARRLVARARLDLVVANDAAHTGESDHEAWLVTSDAVLAHPIGKAAVAAALVDVLARRETSRHGEVKA